jgi:hypothetical protein
MSIQQKALAPRAHRSSLWLCVLVDTRDGERIVPNEIFTEWEEAVARGVDELSYFPEEEARHYAQHLVQVVLDKDTPARWVDEVLEEFEALDDGTLSKEQEDLLDQAIEVVRDFTPTSMEDLGSGESVQLITTPVEGEAEVKK